MAVFEGGGEGVCISLTMNNPMKFEVSRLSKTRSVLTKKKNRHLACHIRNMASECYISCQQDLSMIMHYYYLKLLQQVEQMWNGWEFRLAHVLQINFRKRRKGRISSCSARVLFVGIITLWDICVGIPGTKYGRIIWNRWKKIFRKKCKLFFYSKYNLGNFFTKIQFKDCNFLFW